MIVITGTIRLSSEEELLRVKEALCRRAVRSRADEGNLEYAFSQNIEDPLELRLVEKWTSEALLHAHLAEPDPEFDAILSTASIERATVTAAEAGAEQVLMSR